MKTPKTSILFALICAFLAPPVFCADKEVGALLRSGEWRQGVGSYGVPTVLDGIKPAQWPKDSWVAIKIENNNLRLERQKDSTGWLGKITEQIPKEGEESTGEEPHEETNDANLYLRVPSVVFTEGVKPLYVFKNGTPTLQPELDHQYQLKLGEVPFKFRVQNGLKGKNGAPYGEGATYFIEYDGKKFEYALGYFGWASRVVAITDLDGDGFPDFILEIDGSNSGGTFILLSSTAKPGKNAPTASLGNWGC
jgi:hypothetical protein